MVFENIILEINDSIATLVFNRPKALNALNNALLDELDTAIDEIEANEKIRVLILTGSGEKAFIAGADISELAQMNTLQAKQFSFKGQSVLAKLEKLSIPVIAAVNGFALGGGTEVALACDFIYASEKGVFGLPESTLGLIPGFGGTQRLAKLIGANLARELIYTGRTFPAAKALEYGLVNKISSPEALMDDVLKCAQTMTKRGRVSLRAAKESIECSVNADLETGCRFERDAFAICMASSDAKEGTKAFLEKRKPVFNGTYEN